MRWQIELNPKFTFENFVVGPSNQLAVKAALDTARGLAYRHNPLFITGGEGLGKTHLMVAVGNEIARKNPDNRIAWLTSEMFAHDLAGVRQADKLPRFRKKYLAVDALLLDDLQFLRGKKRVAIELLYILSVLYKAGKQLVITCHRPPAQIVDRPLALCRIIKWGTVVKLGRPEPKTKREILKLKAQQIKFHLSPSILSSLIKRKSLNIRALESGLIRAAAQVSFKKMQKEKG